MAVEISFGPGWGAAPLGSAILYRFVMLVVERKVFSQIYWPTLKPGRASCPNRAKLIYTRVCGCAFFLFLPPSNSISYVFTAKLQLHFLLQVKVDLLDRKVAHFYLFRANKDPVFVQTREISLALDSGMSQSAMMNFLPSQNTPRTIHRSSRTVRHTRRLPTSLCRT